MNPVSIVPIWMGLGGLSLQMRLSYYCKFRIIWMGDLPCLDNVPKPVTPIIIGILMAFIYYVYWHHHIVPMMTYALLKFNQNHYNNDSFESNLTFLQIILPITLFHLCFLLLISSYFRTIFTHPGRVPQNEIWSYDGKDDMRLSTYFSEDDFRFVQSLSSNSIHSSDLADDQVIAQIRCMRITEVKNSKSSKGGWLRKCTSCNPKHFKPDRSHHCSRCNTCVLVMDHHCPAIAGCVGFFNRKYFMLFLLYSILCSGIITFTMPTRAWYTIRPILDYAYFVQHDLTILIVYIISLCMFISLTTFFSFHVYLILNALTTIELREKITSKDPHVQRKSAISHLKYDHGPIRNWKDVFGSEWYIWLLPVQGDLGSDANLQDGTYFYTKERRNRTSRPHDSFLYKDEFSQPLLTPTLK